jgi:uncharacterized protein
MGTALIIVTSLSTHWDLTLPRQTASDPISHGFTPLYLAALQNDRSQVQALIKQGHKWDTSTAAALNDLKLLTSILRNEPNSARPPSKALHEAARHGNLVMVRLLTKHGADPNCDFGYTNAYRPFTPLSQAILSHSLGCARCLLESGASTDVSAGHRESSVLHYSAAQTDIRFAELLLRHHAKINAFDARGLTALHVATASGNLSMVKLLIANGADVHLQATNGGTALFFAAVKRDKSIADLLLSSGARLDIHSACALGLIDKVAAILTSDVTLADVEEPRFKRTPLFWAVEAGNKNVVELLLSYKARTNPAAPRLLKTTSVDLGFLPDPFPLDPPDTPLDVALRNGFIDIAILLKSRGGHSGSQLNPR